MEKTTLREKGWVDVGTQAQPVYLHGSVLSSQLTFFGDIKFIPQYLSEQKNGSVRSYSVRMSQEFT